MNEEFEVCVSKPELTFHSAHFIAHDGFREFLHGHNYQLSIRIMGNGTLGPDGYLVDFTDIKHEAKHVCHTLHQRFLLPIHSPQLTINQDEREVTIQCVDGSRFVLPKQDVVQLPIQHTSAEELASYIWGQLVKAIGLNKLRSRGVHSFEISIAEGVGQEARHRCKLPDHEEDLDHMMQSKPHLMKSSSK